MLKPQLNQYFQRDIFDSVKEIGSSKEAIAATGGLSALAAPVLSVIKDIGGYVEEHTTKMNNPTNIFKSWKRDDETGRQDREGREAITWTNNDGDQPENEANAVLMYIQWKGNLNWAKGQITSAKLRKKLRKTDLDDTQIDTLCDELDRLNGVQKQSTQTASQDLATSSQLQTAPPNTDTKADGKTDWQPTIITVTSLSVLAGIIYAINK